MWSTPFTSTGPIRACRGATTTLPATWRAVRTPWLFPDKRRPRENFLEDVPLPLPAPRLGCRGAAGCRSALSTGSRLPPRHGGPERRPVGGGGRSVRRRAGDVDDVRVSSLRGVRAFL